VDHPHQAQQHLLQNPTLVSGHRADQQLQLVNHLHKVFSAVVGLDLPLRLELSNRVGLVVRLEVGCSVVVVVVVVVCSARNPPQLTPERQRQPTHSELLRVEVAQRMRLVGLEGVVDSDSQHSLLLPQLVIRLVVHLSQRWQLRVTNLEEQLPVRIPHLHLQQLPYKHLEYRSAVTLERPDSEDSLVLQRLQKPTRSQLLLQVVSPSGDRMQTPPLVPQREARLLLRRLAIPSDQPRLQEALGFSDNQRRNLLQQVRLDSVNLQSVAGCLELKRREIRRQEIG
jgi:hypothetical protein